jgi:hypothetical protein
VINKKYLLLFFLLSAITYVSFVIDYSYAHIPQDNKAAPVQEWKDPRNNIKIQFSYNPDKPLVYAPTDLKFSIQDVNTGNHIKDLTTYITIIKDDKTFFKFNDVAIQNGDLSIKVRFSEDGNYQAIIQVSSTDNIAMALASFNIFVPLQPFGKVNVDSLNSTLFSAGIVAISLSAIVIVVIMILRKNEKAGKSTDVDRQKEGKGEGDEQI